MKKLMLLIDKVSTFAGHFFGWSIVALTLLISWEVFSRYALNTPHAWVQDGQIMLYGILFMMAGAYTLASGGHVRGDVLYGFFEPRTQAGIDLVLYIVFFLPGIFALTYAGWTYAGDSFAIREQTFSPEPLPLWPFKYIIPLAGFFLMLQGLVEIARCVLCLRDGKWPPRLGDVAEVDVDKLKHMVDVKDEDIARLDEYVIRQESKQ
jgi:TRAP-type mannitol/chloroaromatic compound transport system permease small subunit